MKSFTISTHVRNLPIRLLWMELEQEEQRFHAMHEQLFPYNGECAICIQKEEETGEQWQSQLGEQV